VYLTCSIKLTGSQLSLPHGINKKLKCETKNKMMSVIDSQTPHDGTGRAMYSVARQKWKHTFCCVHLLRRNSLQPLYWFRMQ